MGSAECAGSTRSLVHSAVTTDYSLHYSVNCQLHCVKCHLLCRLYQFCRLSSPLCQIRKFPSADPTANFVEFLLAALYACPSLHTIPVNVRRSLTDRHAQSRKWHGPWLIGSSRAGSTNSMEQGMLLSIAIHTAEAGLITRCISCAVGLWVTADLGNVDAYLRVIGKED